MIPKKKLLPLPERYPLTCQWEITCRCNLKCVMCYTDCFNTPERIRTELTTAEILRIMDEIADAGCLELTLTGGEPFSRPDFFEIYAHAKSKGFLVTIFSNATLITKRIADRLAALPPFRIEISLHGITKDTFEAVSQGGGSYAKCLEAIRLLLERKLPLVLKTTAMTINRDEILKIREYVRNLGEVGYKLGEDIRRSLDGSDSPVHFQLPQQELFAIESQDPDMRKESCKEQIDSPCETGRYNFHIDAYGMLQLCSGNRNKSYDLRKGSFKDGFYQFLPTFPCPFKASKPLPLEPLSAIANA